MPWSLSQCALVRFPDPPQVSRRTRLSVPTRRWPMQRPKKTLTIFKWGGEKYCRLGEFHIQIKYFVVAKICLQKTNCKRVTGCCILSSNHTASKGEARQLIISTKNSFENHFSGIWVSLWECLQCNLHMSGLDKIFFPGGWKSNHDWAAFEKKHKKGIYI